MQGFRDAKISAHDVFCGTTLRLRTVAWSILQPQICHLFSFPIFSKYAVRRLNEELCWSRGGHDEYALALGVQISLESLTKQCLTQLNIAFSPL